MMEISFEGCPPIYTGRVDSFKLFVAEIMSKTSPAVIEIGVFRKEVTDPGIGGDGGSSPILAWAVNKVKGTLDCCDINEVSIANCRKALEHYGQFTDGVHVHLMDGKKFVEDYPNQIDVIYIDGLDFSPNMREQSMDWHFSVFKAVEPKLAPGAVIMFDDILDTETWFGKGGKAIPYMLESGKYVVLYKGYQVILKKIETVGD